MHSENTPEALLGQSISGYRLVRILGTGGTGVVFFGESVAMPSLKVAVKISTPPLQYSLEERQIFRARFQRETEVLQMLRHPHIVPMLASGTHGDMNYIIFPYMPGGSLADRIAKAFQLGLSEVARITAEVADALDFAHQAGVIHRDLKPANILFDEHGTAYLSDFSIVRIADLARTTLTGLGQVLGTLEYMAPEQANGDQATPSSDIYGLGIVVYDMVTGRTPFTAGTPVQLLLHTLQDPPPAPRQFRPDLPEAAEAAILRALAKSPAERFATAATFATDFGLGIQGRWGPASQLFAVIPASDHAVLPSETQPIDDEPPQSHSSQSHLQRNFRIGVGIVVVIAILASLGVVFYRATPKTAARPAPQHTPTSLSIVATASSVTAATATSKASSAATTTVTVPVAAPPPSLLTATPPPSPPPPLANETTAAPPAMLLVGNTDYAVWTGTDTPDHHIWIAQGSCADLAHCVFGPALATTDYTYGDEGPALATDGKTLYVAFRGYANNIVYYGHFDGSTALHSQPLIIGGVTQTTTQRPAIAWVNGKLAFSWAGSDSQQHINVAYWNGSSNAKAETTDVTGHAPALTLYHSRLYVLFEGTDNRLHDGYMDPSAASPPNTLLGGQNFAMTTNADPVAIAAANGEYQVAWKGTDGRANFGHTTDPETFTWNSPLSLNPGAGPDLTDAYGHTWLWWSDQTTHHIQARLIA